ncbi:multiheme c-type cytochrome [Pseudomonas sp. GD03860]|uniref:cytochrome c3 family protein n=1 Tax=Pseudomonas TaxID=286 RepID=UPI00236476B6|nr:MULTISPECIES: multiheme c-type cytochrome [Pseudomonas]MDD2061002.1 tetratricopeptide repeat protein [Pseudomonas putida]MDH0635376.1 multiheme c-type cytochrome [Pseudomonas sp. GD03860]
MSKPHRKRTDTSQPASPARQWFWPVLAGLALLLSVIAWIMVDQSTPMTAVTTAASPPTPAPVVAPAKLVDEAQCQGCHQAQTDHWKGSHHQLAMQEATEQSVLGDFADRQFKAENETTRFFRRDEQFWVNTVGANGKPKDFRVAYAFGVEPLQQYLIDTGEGHLQALGVAWDTQKNQWFHLYPGQGVDFKDPLHWSKPQQNANFMCVECHTTGFKRNFNAASGAFESHWNSLGVGCQACHGPASNHLEWAAKPGNQANAGFSRSTHQGDNISEVETCARCHARRAPLGDGFHNDRRLMDDYLPSRLTRELYALDGKIKDEVFEYGAFTQSKMFAKGVRCSNCHDPHSTQLKAPGDGVCLQCHNTAGKTAIAGVDGAGLKAKDYTSAEHHHHTPGQPGSQCVDCHMPGKFYMVNDFRHDHGFSIPAPAQALKLGTPDACLSCHQSTKGQQVADQFRLWYGKDGGSTYASSLDQVRAGKPGAVQALLEQLQGNALPAIRRATLLAELANYPSVQTFNAATRDLKHKDAQVRLSALEAVAALLPPEQRQGVLAPLLRDPVLAVRIAAAYALLPARAAGLGSDQAAFDKAIDEYEQVQLNLLERAEANLNLALLYQANGRDAEVEKYLRISMQRDGDFLPARVALVQWLDSHGRSSEARTVLDEALAQHPEAALLHQANGLALIRQGQREAALKSLHKAVQLEPDNAGYAYVLAIALHDQGQAAKAREQLWHSLQQQPYNRDLRLALIHYLQENQQPAEANKLLEALREINPHDPLLQPRPANRG